MIPLKLDDNLTVPLFAAFESFVINVSASVDDALTVDPALLEYGMVFPQQEIDKFVNVGLSQSFQDEPCPYPKAWRAVG